MHSHTNMQIYKRIISFPEMRMRLIYMNFKSEFSEPLSAVSLLPAKLAAL